MNLSRWRTKNLGNPCYTPASIKEWLPVRSPPTLDARLSGREPLPVLFADDETGVVVLLNRPGRREAAGLYDERPRE